MQYSRWIITRLGYYPLVLVRSALIDAASLIQPDYDLLDFTQVSSANVFFSSKGSSLP